MQYFKPVETLSPKNALMPKGSVLEPTSYYKLVANLHFMQNINLRAVLQAHGKVSHTLYHVMNVIEGQYCIHKYGIMK